MSQRIELWKLYLPVECIVASNANMAGSVFLNAMNIKSSPASAGIVPRERATDAEITVIAASTNIYTILTTQNTNTE